MDLNKWSKSNDPFKKKTNHGNQCLRKGEGGVCLHLRADILYTRFVWKTFYLTCG